MKGCIKVLKDQPPNSVEGLLNALRYSCSFIWNILTWIFINCPKLFLQQQSTKSVLQVKRWMWLLQASFPVCLVQTEVDEEVPVVQPRHKLAVYHSEVILLLVSEHPVHDQSEMVISKRQNAISQFYFLTNLFVIAAAYEHWYLLLPHFSPSWLTLLRCRESIVQVLILCVVLWLEV